MTYERQREAALRMVTKYGARASLSQTTSVENPATPWKPTVSVSLVPVHVVTFADDGVTFVDHNIQGDVRIATVVAYSTFAMQVGDGLMINGKTYTVKLAKPLDPDMTGAILWSALIV